MKQLAGASYPSLSSDLPHPADTHLTYPLSLYPLPTRRHAVLQHARDGGLWLYDLASAAGTKLNTQRVETEQFHQLRAGDKVEFGASASERNRTFVVRLGQGKAKDTFMLDSFEKDFYMKVGSREPKAKAKTGPSSLGTVLRTIAVAIADA